jgi:hypothetical protein
MAGQPTGTVTHLFTDIEGSTGLWEQHPEAMSAALARHDAILRETILAHAGHVVKSTGDGFYAVFPTAPDALAAAVAAQQVLQAEAWGEAVIQVRMGLHSGAADERDADYFGPVLNRAARIMSAGHGGQLLLSRATRELLRDQLRAGVELRDLARLLANPDVREILADPGDTSTEPWWRQRKLERWFATPLSWVGSQSCWRRREKRQGLWNCSLWCSNVAQAGNGSRIEPRHSAPNWRRSYRPTS